MDARLERYLDGDLSEAEADAFRRDLAADPALEAELRSWERTLALYAGAWPGGPAAGFEQRVEQAIVAATAVPATAPATGSRGMMTGAVEGSLVRHARSRSRGRAVPGWMAVAAALVTCFGLGLAAARLLPGSGLGVGDPASRGPAAGASFASAGTDEPGRGPALVPVRLVFAPDETEVASVAVAGSFNGWDPGATPMRRHGGLWTAVLLLPAGSHEYMFVLDGSEWRTDPLALQKRDDGFGRENAVIDLAL